MTAPKVHMSEVSRTVILPVVGAASRLPAWGLTRPAGWILIASAAGILAALASCLLDFKLGLPGHAILRCVVPMAAGLALAPRRGTGSLMSASASLTALLLRVFGFGEKGLGSLMSLLVMGPALDVAASRSRSGRQLWFGLAAAGMGTNLMAFAAQSLAKAWHLEVGGGQPLSTWWLKAIWSYPVCGTVAGLLSAALMFRCSRVQPPAQTAAASQSSRQPT